MKLVLPSHVRLGTAVLLTTFASIYAACSEDILSAAGAGDTAAVAKFLQANPDAVNARDRDASTPLHLAAQRSHLEMAKVLLDHKADVNATNEDGCTPLHYASLATDVAVLKLLLANHAEVNPRDHRPRNFPNLRHGGRTPLHYAASWRRTDAAELLLAAGADVNAQDGGGMTPLHVVLYEPPIYARFPTKEGAEEWARMQGDIIRPFVLVLLAHKASVTYEEKMYLAKLGLTGYLDEIVAELTTTNSPLFDAYKNRRPVALSDAMATRFSNDPGVRDIQMKAFDRLASVHDRSTVKIVAAYLYSPCDMTFMTENVRQQSPPWCAIWALRWMVDNPPQGDDVKVWQQWWEQNKDKYP